MKPREPSPAGPLGPVGPVRPVGSGAGDNDEIRRKIESLRLMLLRGASGGHPCASIDGKADPEGPAAIEGAREVESVHGRCLIIEKHLTACPNLERLAEAYRALEAREDAPRGGLAFLDLETTGLSATPLFLAGLLVEQAGSLQAVQLLARDYSEERCLISILDGLLGGAQVCITFNGKSFDLPYLRERAKYHRLALEARPEQLDLLHHARRRWRHSLPDCRLLTLEWYILGRRRMGDVGGWEVPCIYHEFVHTKDATRLRGVLRHNLMDVLAMAELLVSLAEA